MTRKPTDPLPDHFGTDDWEDMDTAGKAIEVAAPVSEEMVERACVSFGIPETNWFDRAKMRAALTAAALAAKGGQ